MQGLGECREGDPPAWRGIRSVDILTTVPVDQVPSRSERRRQIAAGIGCAFAGHVVAGGPWLYAVFMSTVHAPPDSVFLVAGLTAVLQFLLFAVSMTVGVTLLRSRRRSIGIGLLTGWFMGGVVVLDSGTAIISFLAALV